MPASKKKNVAGKKAGQRKKRQKRTEPMPSLIFHNIPFVEEKEENQETSVRSPSTERLQDIAASKTTARQHRNRAIALSGAIVISSIIFILWGWSFQTRFASINWRETPEGQMAASAKTDLNQIFMETKEKIYQKETAEKQLKNILRQIISTNAAAPAPTTSTSGVQSVAASSTL